MVEHALRQVDSERRAARRGAGRGPSGLTGSAADIEHVIALGDRSHRQETVMVGSDRPVEVLGIVGPIRPLVAVPSA